MDLCLKGEAGGIAGLRRVLDEYAEPINYDLRSNGWPGVDWIGTDQLSWWDLKTFLTWIPRDGKSAWHRAINPDNHVWSDPAVYLAAAIATAVEEVKFLTAATLPWKEEEMPSRFHPRRFGPADPDEAEAEAEDTAGHDRALEIAAEMRAAR